jgi:outer membrane protein assembly factor BamB
MRQAWRVPMKDMVELPLASDGRYLFVATRSGEVTALSLVNGEIAWTKSVGARVVAAASGAVVARAEDGVVVGLDPDSGRPRWKSSTGVGGSLVPVLDSGTAFVAGAGLAAVEAETGRLLWVAKDGGPAGAPPAVAGSRVYVSEAGGVLRCRDRATGSSSWAFETGSTPLTSPSVAPDGTVLVGAARSLQAIRPDGSRRRWRWRLGADAMLPPAVQESSALLAAYDATLYCLNRGNGHLNWRAPLPSRPISEPLLSGVTVLVACLDNRIVGFDVRTGRPLGELRTNDGMLGPPILVADRAYVALRDRSVVAYALNLAPAVEARRPTGKAARRRPPTRNP